MNVEVFKDGLAIAGARPEAPGMGRTRAGQPSGPRARDAAVAAHEIARLAQLPSDLVVAAVVAGVLILRARGIGHLPIAVALAEALGPADPVPEHRPVGAALGEPERGSHADDAPPPRPGRDLGTPPAVATTADPEEGARAEAAAPPLSGR